MFDDIIKKLNLYSRRRPRKNLRRNVMVYLALLTLALSTASGAVYIISIYNKENADSFATTLLKGKMNLYKSEASKFDVVFIGDSRTYCGIHPYKLNPKLNINSVNLSYFANWFPTQYPMAVDLVESAPKNTTVVWSVGHQNFFPSAGIKGIYPIGIKRIPEYMDAGFKFGDILKNILYFNPLTTFFVQRETIYNLMQARLENRIFTINPAGEAQINESISSNHLGKVISKNDVQYLKTFYENDSAINNVTITEDNGHATSLVAYPNLGGYVRVEIDRDYFRNKQNERLANKGGMLTESEAESRWSGSSPDPRYYELFKKIISVFKKNNVRLIVNEIQEAPFMYQGNYNYNKWREFMDKYVRSYVEDQGFVYTRPDYSQLSNDDYFDYNHLNLQGINKYSILLANELRPHILN